MKNEFDKRDKAYRQGKRAAVKGLLITDNPYPSPKRQRSGEEYDDWARGYLAGKWGNHSSKIQSKET